jgi:gliding motility-associated-like protein
MTDFNDLSTINSYPPGTFTDNTIYYVPITMYGVGTGDYNYVNSTMPCYETGTPYAVQYLPDFTSSNTEDCLAGTATVTVNGALPAIDGSNFTASNLLPATASFNNTTTPDGGDFVISGLVGGDTYSFDVMDDNGCAYTITGGPILPLEDPSFSYTGSPWCTSDLVQDPKITGVAGGTFVSSPAGLSINATTGQITPATSTQGQTYDVTYTTPGACYDESTVSVTIANDPIVDPIMDQTICDTESFNTITFTGSAGTNFDWVNDNALIGLGAAGSTTIPSFVGVGPTSQTVSTITVTPSAGACIGPSETFVLTVNPPPVVSFTGAITGCEPLMVTLKNNSAPIGQDCLWDLGDGTTLVGCDSIMHEYNAGLFDVSLTVTTNEGCTASLTEPGFVEVFELPIASFSFSPQEIDIDDTEVEFDNNSDLADSYLWDFGDNSATSLVENPIHLYPQVPGKYLVTLWAYNHNGLCKDSLEQLVIVQDVIIFYVPNVFTPDGDEYNEDFSPVFTSGIDIYDFHLTIFNRWGETIFETFDPSKGWNGHYGDGGLVDDGTYIWQIQFHETMSDRHHEHRGHVTVLK